MAELPPSLPAAICLAAALLLPSAVVAQPGADCGAFNRAYADHEDRLARLRAEIYTGRPLAELSLFSTQASGEAQLLQSTLQLMAANHCPLPDHPIRSDAYARAIAACLAAEPNEATTKCSRSNWKPAAQ